VALLYHISCLAKGIYAQSWKLIKVRLLGCDFCFVVMALDSNNHR